MQQLPSHARYPVPFNATRSTSISHKLLTFKTVETFLASSSSVQIQFEISKRERKKKASDT
jgi:hypothetical protein